MGEYFDPTSPAAQVLHKELMNAVLTPREVLPLKWHLLPPDSTSSKREPDTVIVTAEKMRQAIENNILVSASKAAILAEIERLGRLNTKKGGE